MLTLGQCARESKSGAHIYAWQSQLWHDVTMVTPRERARERTLAEIRTLAWRHLESEGAAGLSLRAIARELGVVSSAIYRYVPSRDDLLTELIIEGYQDLAERTEAAESELVAQWFEETGPLVVAGNRAALGRIPADDRIDPASVDPAPVDPASVDPAPAARASGDASIAATAATAATAAGPAARQRWLTVARTMRAWALERPEAWALLFGSPVPGYDAPAERTTAVGTRTMTQMVRIIVGALEAGEELTPAVTAEDIPSSLEPGLAAATASIGLAAAEPHLVAATVLGWNAVLAAITSEVFEQLGPSHFGDASAWADLAFVASADLVGLPRR